MTAAQGSPKAERSLSGAQHAPQMTACRPDAPGPRCTGCARRSLPVSHVTAGGRLIEHVVMDPTSLPRGARRCDFFAEMAA
jgi:hypothetical protein